MQPDNAPANAVTDLPGVEDAVMINILTKNVREIIVMIIKKSAVRTEIWDLLLRYGVDDACLPAGPFAVIMRAIYHVSHVMIVKYYYNESDLHYLTTNGFDPCSNGIFTSMSAIVIPPCCNIVKIINFYDV